MYEVIYLIRYTQKSNFESCKHYYATAKYESIANKIIKEAKIKYPAKIFWKRMCKVITK